MSNLLLMGVGMNPIGTQATTSAPAQLRFIENYPLHSGFQFQAYSQRTVSFQAFNVPLSISFAIPVMMFSRPATGGSQTIRLGLYSMNAGTLSLQNSASKSFAFQNAIIWQSFFTSAAQNITPGTWYWGVHVSSGGTSHLSLLGNSSVGPINANPGGFFAGRMTVSTAALPAGIATSALDITGSDAIRFPYIILTA
jgi:hypothetical protein